MGTMCTETCLFFIFLPKKFTDAIRQTILYYSCGLIVFITIGTGITVLLVRQVVCRVVELTHITTNFPNSSSDFPKLTNSTDEIGLLSTTFSKMARNLAASHKQLEEQNQTLEQEVNKRTHELQLKIDEMEKMQKITIDRELKMIEMKK